ncbi:MAG: membrane protein insertase YidC [Actinomycetota bacterium]|nr:membrane protein insertase YidC [Actinomycetota bacterium]
MLNWLYEVIAKIVVGIHAGLAPVFGADSGASWALSIVLLTVAMRLLLFPLFVKQIRAQRAMQTLQPQMKELQKKYKGNREQLNVEMMKLYKEHNANPIAGCLPLVLQLPVFFALFHVLDRIKPSGGPGHYVFRASSGLTQAQVESAAHAKIFGVAPIAAAFNSPTSLLTFLNAHATGVRVLAVIMIVLMGLSTFITQRQMMARSGPVEGQQAQVQKLMLYVLPFSFAIFGFRFPLGVLLYWLTTNLWSMGQQAFVIRRMPPVAVAGAGAGRPAAPPKPTPGKSAAPLSPAPRKPTGADKPSTNGARPAGQAGTASSSAVPPAVAQPAGTPTSTPAVAAVGARRPGGNRGKRKGRRGGRR